MEQTAIQPKRLYKSRINRMIDGVCGGIAEYFEVDPTVVRILWVLITLLGGTGLFLYIAGMIIMPVNPDHIYPSSVSTQANHRGNTRRFWGILLILLGALILLINFGWFAVFDWWSISWKVIFPIILIVLGMWFIYLHTSRPNIQGQSSDYSSPETSPPLTAERKELRRSVIDKKLFGVCGGIAHYFNVDPTIVRILFVLIVIASTGWGLLLYIVLTFLMPEEKSSTTSI
ncbi:MAG TPA: PspC domain-containing protein [Bacteroidota bacterium]|nr:PspC domain-containing protein [Bacteroidota bacterium]